MNTRRKSERNFANDRPETVAGDESFSWRALAMGRGRSIWHAILFCLLVPCGNVIPATIDCSSTRIVSDKTVCGNVLLSKLDERDAILYQKALAADPILSQSISKESQARRWLCGNDMACIAEVYESSSRSYLECIEKGARTNNSRNIALPREEKRGLLIFVLFVSGMVSFIVTWKIFNFFLSLHDAFDLSPFDYYCKKIGAACAASITATFIAYYVFTKFC